MSKKGVVDIHGKQYKTVVLRVNEFRDECKITEGWGLTTLIVELNDKWACVKASVVDPAGKVVGTGHGVEFWQGSNYINKTSALENAETSAVGRALASIGLGGEEYASADEVINAIKTQKKMEEKPEEPAPNVVEANFSPDQDAMREVLDNIPKLTEKMGEKDHKVWHSRVLANYFNGATKIGELSDEQLKKLVEMQQDRLKMKE